MIFRSMLILLRDICGWNFHISINIIKYVLKRIIYDIHIHYLTVFKVYCNTFRYSL